MEEDLLPRFATVPLLLQKYFLDAGGTLERECFMGKVNIKCINTDKENKFKTIEIPLEHICRIKIGER